MRSKWSAASGQPPHRGRGWIPAFAGMTWVWLAFGVPTTANGDNCCDNHDSAKDYFPHKAELQYAESFAIEYFDQLQIGHRAYPVARCTKKPSSTY